MYHSQQCALGSDLLHRAPVQSLYLHRMHQVSGLTYNPQLDFDPGNKMCAFSPAAGMPVLAQMPKLAKPRQRKMHCFTGARLLSWQTATHLRHSRHRLLAALQRFMLKPLPANCNEYGNAKSRCPSNVRFRPARVSLHGLVHHSNHDGD